MIWDLSEATERLNEFRAQLASLFQDAVTTNSLQRGTDRLQRWCYRLGQWLTKNLNKSEVERFEAYCPDWTGLVSWQELDAAVRRLAGYTEALIEDIADDPEHWEDVISASTDDQDNGMDDELTATDSKIFLGHGQSQLWRKLHDYLGIELGLDVEAFESESRSGRHIVEVLEEFLRSTTVAIIVLTAEDETKTGVSRARQNVVHEVGLFHGRLGFRRVILVVQDGIEEFSNIHGLQQVRFRGDRIDQAFREVRSVLEREGLVGRS